DTIPRVHAIYMGGGFPETHAPQLAANRAFRENLRELAQSGLPIYAECGGLIFLGESILLGDQVYPMSGILPIRFGLSKRPQGHGYTQVKVTCDNPFYGKGEILKGHEFRYSQVLDMDDTHGTMAFSMELGKGIMEKKDGLFRYNTLGTYTHIHALGSPSWAPALVAKAEAYRAGRI
ncbi:MAG: cobyrinic acid a,c-diamide synthase, partial [Desulfovibrionales bacterium]|nr:cobyrinic acid a,c-diamide synthase [Desulfovibrionales bacterium]